MRIRAYLESYESEVFYNIATCRAVLHNRVAEVRRSLLKTVDAVAGFYAAIASAEPGQTEKAESNYTSNSGTKSGAIKDQ